MLVANDHFLAKAYHPLMSIDWTIWASAISSKRLNGNLSELKAFGTDTKANTTLCIIHLVRVRI